MAKVADLKFTVNNEEFKIPVNVGIDGVFKCNLPQKIYQPLKIQGALTSNTLQGLKTIFYDAFERYKNAETKQTIYIAIRYAASGKYQNKADGYPFITGYNNKYNLEFSHHDRLSAVALEFEIVLKEDIDGAVTYYTAKQGKQYECNGHFYKEQNENTEKWFKNNQFYNLDKWKLIPYDETSLSTLLKARENMRALSEMLHRFIEQDEQQMIETLSNGKLLLN